MIEFFAGINSEKGYLPRLEEPFKDIKTLYILNGTPGCGKSTLMKRVLALWQQKGYTTQKVYCSSDPSSLDGVLCKELSVGVCDGTAPHPVLPKIPLLTHITVDLSGGGKKIQCEAELLRLNELKALEYKKGYALIASAVHLRRCGDLCSGTDTQAAKKAALDFFNKKLKSKLPEGESKSAVLHAFTAGGTRSLTPISAHKLMLLKDSRYSEAYLEELARLGEYYRRELIVSPHPYDSEKISAVYFPAVGMYISLFGDGDKRINLCKAPLEKGAKEYYALSKGVLARARECFAEAARYHKEIEKIYLPAIDFTRAEEAYCRITSE